MKSHQGVTSLQRAASVCLTGCMYVTFMCIDMFHINIYIYIARPLAQTLIAMVAVTNKSRLDTIYVDP